MKADELDREVNARLVQVLLIIVGVLLSVCLLFAVKLKEAGTVVREYGGPKGLEIGTIAPSFSLLDQEGEEVSLDDFNGQGVILAFTDLDCPWCKVLYHALRKLDTSSDKVQVLILSRDEPDRNQDAVRQYQLSFPVLNGTRGLFREQYKVSGVPYLYAIDSSGAIVDRGLPGTKPLQMLKRMIRKIGKVDG